MIIAAIPAIRTYCAATDALVNDQAPQVEVNIPKGTRMFTLNIALLSQSRLINLSEQNSDNDQAAKASKIIDMTISSHAKFFSIQSTVCDT